MNPVQIHLMANHFPFFGAGAAFLILALGLARGNASFHKLASLILVVAALSIPVVYFSGEGAEDSVEAIPGVTESLIDAHEEAAETAAVFMAGLGVLAFAHLMSWAFPVASRWRTRGAYLILIGSGLAVVWMGWTAHLGGLIRHAEELQAPAQQEVDD